MRPLDFLTNKLIAENIHSLSIGTRISQIRDCITVSKQGNPLVSRDAIYRKSSVSRSDVQVRYIVARYALIIGDARK